MPSQKSLTTCRCLLADEQNGSIDYERRHSFPARTSSIASAGQIQGSGSYNSSVVDRPPWYRHSADAPSPCFGQVGISHPSSQEKGCSLVSRLIFGSIGGKFAIIILNVSHCNRQLQWILERL